MPTGNVHWKFCTEKLAIRCPHKDSRKCPWDDTDLKGKNWHTLHRPSAGQKPLIPFGKYTFSEPEAVRYVRAVLDKMEPHFSDFRGTWGVDDKNTEDDDRRCWNAHLSVDFASDFYSEFKKLNVKYTELWKKDEYQAFVTSVAARVIGTP